MNTPALPLSGPPVPHLRTRVAAESFGVRCILRGIPLGTLGSGDLGTPGKHPVMGSGCFLLTGAPAWAEETGVSPTHWESLALIRSTDLHPHLPGASVSRAGGGA